MSEYVLCPTCRNPALAGEPCAVCAERRAREAAEAREGFAPAADAPAAANAAAAAGAYTTLFEEEKTPDSEDYQRLMRRTYAPMGAWSSFGVLLLFSVPVIGLLFAIVFACGGCQKKQKAALARGYLLLVLFSLVLAVLSALVVLLLLGGGYLQLPYLPFGESLIGMPF